MRPPLPTTAVARHVVFYVKLEEHEEGAIHAEVPELCTAVDATSPAEAMRQIAAKALQVIAEQLEHGEQPPRAVGDALTGGPYGVPPISFIPTGPLRGEAFAVAAWAGTGAHGDAKPKT